MLKIGDNETKNRLGSNIKYVVCRKTWDSIHGKKVKGLISLLVSQKNNNNKTKVLKILNSNNIKTDK